MNIIFEGGFCDKEMELAAPENSVFIASRSASLLKKSMRYTEQFSPLIIDFRTLYIMRIIWSFCSKCKNIQENCTVLVKDKLPPSKRYIHTAFTILLRKTLLDSRCGNTSPWNDDKYPLFSNISQKIIMFATDDLIDLSTNKLALQETRRTFSRKLCTIIEAPLGNQYKENTFSRAI